MNHALEPRVLHEGRAAGHLGGNVDARHGLAHDAVFRRIAEIGHGVGLHMQVKSGDKIAISELAPVGGDDSALGGVQVRRRDIQLAGGQCDKFLAGLCSGVQDGGAAVLHGVRAGGEALVGRGARVGGDQGDCPHVHSELFGGDLEQGGFCPLTKLALAGHDGDRAAGLDANPAVETGEILQAAGQGRALGFGGRGCRRALGQRPGQCGEGDDERAGAAKQGATRDRRGEGGRHRLTYRLVAGLRASSARRTARRMRICVPQRHRLVCIWARMSSSLGAPPLSTSVCARITMPAVQ